MISYPQIDPVLFHLGPLHVRWYGVMYILGFISTYLLVRHQIKKYALHDLKQHYENLNTILIISMIIGGRLGYVLFYNFFYYLEHPLEIAAIWHGGMSFHGALLGVILGGYLYCRHQKLNFFKTADIYVVTVPIGLGLGRIGNFINGELYGRVTDVPWAMIFPAGGPFPRHPSQLYESLLEGLLLFVILWKLKDIQPQRKWASGVMLSHFLILYGLFRLVVEFFRQPDSHIGFIIASITMGQILSILMVFMGIILFSIREKMQHNLHIQVSS
jgi:phosphatidylglycerol:prolipoprotein diacylglycerol transferase